MNTDKRCILYQHVKKLDEEDMRLFKSWVQSISSAVITKPSIRNFRLNEVMNDYSRLILDIAERALEKGEEKNAN